MICINCGYKGVPLKKNKIRKQKFPEPKIIGKLNEYIYSTYIFPARRRRRKVEKHTRYGGGERNCTLYLM